MRYLLLFALLFPPMIASEEVYPYLIKGNLYQIQRRIQSDQLRLCNGFANKQFFYTAVQRSWIAILKELLAYNHSLQTHAIEITPQELLATAFIYEQKEVIQWLLQNQPIDLNVSYKGAPFLVMAAIKGYSDIAQKMLDAGADVNAQATQNFASSKKLSTQGFTALHHTCRNRDKKTTSILLAYKADPNILDDGGRPPLFWAAMKGAVGIIAQLFDHGAHTRVIDQEGRNSLHHAVEKKRFETVQMLLERGEDLNIQDKEGYTPFLLSFQMYHIDIALLLLRNGANPNLGDINGVTALHWAILLLDLPMVKWLLAHNANPKASTIDGKNWRPWHALFKNWKTKISKHFVYYIEKKKTTKAALKKGHDIIIARWMIERGMDPNDISYDSTGNTLLHYASKHDNISMVDMLLDHEADYTLKTEFGQRPLDLSKGDCRTLIAKKIAEDARKGSLVHGYMRPFLSESATKQIPLKIYPMIIIVLAYTTFRKDLLPQGYEKYLT